MSDETNETSTTPSIAERLAAARAARAERQKKESAIDDERRLAMLELETELSAKYGRAGEDFALVNAGPDGWIGVKRGEGVLYKRYRAKIMREKDTQEDLIAFVTPCVVHPDLAKFTEITGRQGAVLDMCGAALLKLSGLWEQEHEGK